MEHLSRKVTEIQRQEIMVGGRSRNYRDDAITRERRRELRRQATKPERLMWAALRNHRLGGLKFRRQHPIGIYIVDFFCAEKQTVVEIDGDYHDYVQEDDLERQRYLEARGLTIIRFSNDEVLQHYEAVVEGLARQLGVDLLP